MIQTCRQHQVVLHSAFNPISWKGRVSEHKMPSSFVDIHEKDSSQRIFTECLPSFSHSKVAQPQPPLSSSFPIFFWDRPLPFVPVRLCLSGFQRSSCEHLADETDPRAADIFGVRGKGSYGINRFGHSTSGKFNCQVRDGFG